jgi:hypothetical protein
MIAIVVDLRAQTEAAEAYTKRLRRDENWGMRAEMDIWREHVDIPLAILQVLGLNPASPG